MVLQSGTQAAYWVRQFAVGGPSQEGGVADPIAVKTCLGWCIYGKPANLECERLLHICECIDQGNIHETIRDYFDMQLIGVAHDVEQDSDEQRAKQILDATTGRIEKRFESGLLCRKDDIELPPSIDMARRRFNCLQRRMERDGHLKELSVFSVPVGIILFIPHYRCTSFHHHIIC